MNRDVAPINTAKTVTYRVLRVLVISIARILMSPGVRGIEKIPEKGPVLICPVHRSNVDFLLTAFLTRRKIFFMAHSGLFKISWVGGALRSVGVIPVDREVALDRSSVEQAEAVLRLGQVLVLFPEGGIKCGATIEELHDGAMFIAVRTGATVVPVGLNGTDAVMPLGTKWPRRHKVRVVVGDPLIMPTVEGRISRSRVTAMSEELRVGLEKVYQPET